MWQKYTQVCLNSMVMVAQESRDWGVRAMTPVTMATRLLSKQTTILYCQLIRLFCIIDLIYQHNLTPG